MLPYIHGGTESSPAAPAAPEGKRTVRIDGTTALVTGANRGLGYALAQALTGRGAARVYGAVRDPEAELPAGVERVVLDITRPADVAAAAIACGDVSLLVNNAVRAAASCRLIGDPTMDAARQQMEVNYFGTLAMCRAFAPVLAANGGGALVNLGSVTSFVNFPEVGSFCATKAALWSLTNGVRAELRAQGTLVTGVYSGFIDTRNAAGTTLPKHPPAAVAAAILDAVADGTEELIMDDRTRQMKDALPRELELIYPALERQFHALRR
jgi:NAD(P)-dependent dehydrogenase (short-subunit alcohol dehydrogenase family)